MSIAKKPRGFLNEAVWPNRITIRQDAISDSYAVETRPFARGKFATVRRCRHIESGKDFAAKYLRKRRRSEDVRHELIHEALVLAIAEDCERIVSLKEVFETPTEVILVLEMATGGELQHVLDSEDCLPEASCRQLLLQICQGLEFLHRNHIAHLDIKPANLLLSKAFPHGEAKLCDFGISRLILPGEEIHEIAGTPDYIAPEVLQYEPISLATDMWSVGILTYVLLTGHTPFGGDTKQDTFCNITLGELDFPQDLFEDISPEAIHFITQLVVKDPKKRLTVGDVLRHPWLNSSSSSPMSISVTSLSEGDHNNNIKNNSNNKTCSLIQCETPSTSSMGSCESDNEMEEIKSAATIIKDHELSKAESVTPPVCPPSLVPNDSVTLSHSKTAEQVVEIQDSSEGERISVPDSAESPAPEEELPSLQSSTSSDSPVPAKKDKECELRAPQPKKVNFTSKANKSSPTTIRSFQPSPVDYPTSLSPQVSPPLRRGCPPRSTKISPTNTSLTRSCSVSPVRTSSVVKHPLVASSKSLSSTTLQPSKSFKVSSQSENRQSKKLANPSFHPSPTVKRVPSTALKRPQPSPTPKTSRSSNQNLTSPLSVKTQPVSPRASLLSPTVSSALKSCASPLRPVNSPLRSPDAESLNSHRRSLIISTRCKQMGHPNRSNRVSGLGVNIK